MRGIFRHIRNAAPTLLVLAAMAAAVAFAPCPSDAANEPPPTKAELMDHLPDVAAVACDPGGLYLFSETAPLMAVWTASEPAELYTVDGHFAGALSTEEFDLLIDVTRPFSETCLAPETDPGGPLQYVI